MRVTQEIVEQGSGPERTAGAGVEGEALVLAFTTRERVASGETWDLLRARFPGSTLVAVSTAGEIFGARVLDDSLVATAISFEKSTFRAVRLAIHDASESAAVGRALAERLSSPGLVHVLVFSDGVTVNGSELVRGMTERLPAGVALTGGLSADGAASSARTSASTRSRRLPVWSG